MTGLSNASLRDCVLSCFDPQASSPDTGGTQEANGSSQGAKHTSLSYFGISSFPLLLGGPSTADPVAHVR